MLSRQSLLEHAYETAHACETPPTLDNVLKIMEPDFGEISEAERLNVQNFLRLSFSPSFGIYNIIVLLNKDFPLDIFTVLMAFCGPQEYEIVFGKHRRAGQKLKNLLEDRVAQVKTIGIRKPVENTLLDPRAHFLERQYLEFAVYENGSLIYLIPKNENGTQIDVMAAWNHIRCADVLDEQSELLQIWNQYMNEIPRLEIPGTWKLRISEQRDNIQPLINLCEVNGLTPEVLRTARNATKLVWLKPPFGRIAANETVCEIFGQEHVCSISECFDRSTKFKEVWNDDLEIEQNLPRLFSCVSKAVQRWTNYVLNKFELPEPF